MFPPSIDVQKLALTAANVLICLWSLAALYATWAKPELQRYWLLKPRWRGGIDASRVGMTGQAIFGFALGAYGLIHQFGFGYESVARTVLLLAVGLGLLAWLSDLVGH